MTPDKGIGEMVKALEKLADTLAVLREPPAWLAAPRPRRWHRCHPVMDGFVGFLFVERCAYGATRLNHRGRWLERNSRKR